MSEMETATAVTATAVTAAVERVKRVCRKPLTREEKELLVKLHVYFKEVNDKNMSSVVTSSQLLSTASGIPLSTLKRVLLEHKRALEANVALTGDDGADKPPKRKRNRKKIIILADSDRTTIRTTISNFNISGEEFSIRKLYKKLKIDINYPGSIWSLRKELKEMGFKWKIIDDKRKILVETHELRTESQEPKSKSRSSSRSIWTQTDPVLEHAHAQRSLCMCERFVEHQWHHAAGNYYRPDP